MTVSGGETRDYVGPFQYLNGSLFEIGHEEGRHSPTGGYEYFHKDHLGNVRVAFGASGITQYTDYDPWSLPLWGGLSGGSSTNRNTFLGREFEAETGYQDLMNRQYDAPIARFTTIDPVTDTQESFSTYHYSFNNPVRFSDPNGLMGDDCCPGVVNFLTGVGNALAQDLHPGNQAPPAGGLSGQSSFRSGQAFGHGLSVLVGLGEMVAGAGGAAGSGAAEIASVGVATPIAVPAAIVSVGLMAHGANTIKNALTNSAKDENGRVNASGDSRNKNRQRDQDGSNFERMGKSQGNAPRSNQAQNEQTRTLAKKYGLDKSQQRKMHDLISKKGLSFKEIETVIQKNFPKKEK